MFLAGGYTTVGPKGSLLMARSVPTMVHTPQNKKNPENPFLTRPQFGDALDMYNMKIFSKFNVGYAFSSKHNLLMQNNLLIHKR